MSERLQKLPRRTIDVSKLPTTAWDTRACVWWGNTLLILIETTSIALILASYFYLKRNFEHWPPPRIENTPVMYDAAPGLLWGTLNLLVQLASVVPMVFTDLAARRKDKPTVVKWLGVMIVLAGVSSVLRFYEFPAIHFQWNENAYGSLVWTILGLHLIYILGTGAEFLIMWLWVITHDLDSKHGLDITLAGVYWYWSVAVWVIIYAVVYWTPRIL